MSTPFEEFFEGFWQQNLDAVAEHGEEVVFTSGHAIKDATWDRRGAYLLWSLINGEQPLVPFDKIENPETYNRRKRAAHEARIKAEREAVFGKAEQNGT